MDHSSLLPLVICNFPPQHRENCFPPPHICLLNFSVPVYVYRFSGFRTHTPWQTTLSARDCTYVRFLLPLAFQTPLISTVRSATLPFTLFKEVVLYIYNTIKFFCHRLYSILGSSDLLNDFFKFTCIKIHSAIKFSGF